MISFSYHIYSENEMSSLKVLNECRWGDSSATTKIYFILNLNPSLRQPVSYLHIRNVQLGFNVHMYNSIVGYY